MGFRAALAIAGGLLLAGCVTRHTPAPVATNFPIQQQAKLQAAAHWQTIARQMAQDLKPTLKTAPRRALHIQPLQASPFAQGVATQLATNLVKDGFVVVKTAEPGALRIELDTQVVPFSKNRRQYRYHGDRGVLIDGAWFYSLFAPGTTPKNELIVTLSVADQQRYYARTTSVFYTADADSSLYEANNAQGRRFLLKDH